MHYVIACAPCTNLADLGTERPAGRGKAATAPVRWSAKQRRPTLLRPSVCHPWSESSSKSPSMIPFSAEIPQPPVVRGTALSDDSVRFRLYASSAARARQLTTHLSSTQISPDDPNDDDRVGEKNGAAPGTHSRSRSTLGKQVIPPPNGLVALSTHTPPTLSVSALVAASDHNLPQPPAVQY